MIEDLVTNERDEPYRLFTARSENRLYIREDNTIQRMSSYREQLDLNLPVDRYNKTYNNQLDLVTDIVSNCSSLPQVIIDKYGLRQERSISEYFKKTDLDPTVFMSDLINTAGLKLDKRVLQNAAINLKYEGYIKRSEKSYSKQEKLLTKRLDWNELSTNKNISFECRQRIKKFRPETFSQLKNIKGIRPATLAYIAGRFK
jgi:tRNA uridine 5-carboxymethylaminomethyl modification enzyme